MAHFDLAIIGTGSGNSLVTPDFEDKRVAVVERHLFGGTCLNVGCIPTKMYVYAAEIAAAARNSARYGVDAHVDRVRWTDIRDRIFGRIDAIEAGGRSYRIEGHNTTAYLGHARFVGQREVEVEMNSGSRQRFTADQVVVAAGARPHIPEVILESGVPYLTSDTVMRIDDLPSSMVIYGAGVIAVEFAHVFSSLGVKVTLVARSANLLRSLDGEVSRAFTALAHHKWEVRTCRVVEGAAPTADGVRLTLDDGSSVEGAALLVATGRIPNTEDLGLEAAGIDLRKDGRIAVDEYGRTTAPDVWALGDISSPYQLKHVANAEARMVAHNLVHLDDLRAMPHEAVPAGVFTDPQIASVGATEEQLIARGALFVSKVQKFGDTAYGWAMEDTTSFLKVLADPRSGLILGAHSMGPHSTTLIQPLIMAMSMGITALDVARGQYWIHPALSEVVENALLGLELDERGLDDAELVDTELVDVKLDSLK